MSRVGKNPVAVPSGVEVKVDGAVINDDMRASF